ncbi:MAG: LysR family transcriptional regulator [Proteobacteria bacterium]|nr:LysR family transcriptional regulator [Pseudomonadota bacterium]
MKYFQEVARRGSVRKAAATLNVASSAVNRQLLKLEAELGVELFDRLPGGMRITRAGEVLLRHVADTLHDFERVRSDIDDLRGVKSGHVSIAAVDSLLVDFLPQAVEAFRAEFPAVTYSLIAMSATDVPAEIIGGRADIGFTFVSKLPSGAQLVASIPAPIGVVMPAKHPLASQRKIAFKDCRRYPVLLQQGPLPRMFALDPEFAAFRETIGAKLVSNSITLVKQAIRRNMGISFYTKLGFLQELADGELVWRPLASRAINTLRLGIVTPTERKLPRVTGLVLDYLIERLHAVERTV